MSEYDREKYAVEPFDLNLVRPGHLIAVVGTNTKLAEAIIREITAHLAPKIKHVRVFSCSTAIEDIATYIPATYINNYFDKTELKSLYQKQSTNIEWCDNQTCPAEAKKALKDQFSTLLILDQCASDKNTAWFKDSACNEIFQRHASNECTLIYRALEMDYIPMTFTHHFDFCFVVSSSAAEEHSKVFKRFGGLAQTLAILRRAFTYNIMDTSALVIMRAATTVGKSKLEEEHAWKSYFACYNPFANPISTYFRFGPSHLWSKYISNKTHWKTKPTSENGEDGGIVGKKSNRRDKPNVQTQSNPTIDEVLKLYAQHKRLRIEVLSDDDQDDEGGY